jgi:hypothetical protein
LIAALAWLIVGLVVAVKESKWFIINVITRPRRQRERRFTFGLVGAIPAHQFVGEPVGIDTGFKPAQ